MASFRDSQRSSERSVSTERMRTRFAGRSRHAFSLTLAAISLAAIGAVVASIELATLHRDTAAPSNAPAFLTKTLGAAAPARTIVRTPAPDIRVAVEHGGYRVSTKDGG